MSDIHGQIADFLREEADRVALSNETYDRVLRRAKPRRVMTAAAAGLTVIMVGIAGVVMAGTLRAPSPIVPAGSGGSPDATATSKPSPTSRDVDGCSVTVPPRPGFVPPEPYPAEPPFDQVWYGGSELWTALDPNGSVWSGLPVEPDGSVGDKTFWWSENLSTEEGEDFSGSADITVTAVHLDGSAPTVVEKGGVPSFNREIKNFMLVGLELPEPGCWEVTARYKGTELSYVLLVED